MTASDIKNQFQPVPFGSRAPSAFEIITQPQNNSIWDGFRNIDSDKEQRVLQVHTHTHAHVRASHVQGSRTCR